MSDFNFFLNRQGPKGAQGVQGETGFSPTIAPSADNDGLTVYKLVITNENNTYETDNLMGNLNIVDDGGTYLRYDRDIGSVRAAEANTATASAAGVVRLATSTDYTNLADDAVMTPSSFADNYNNIFDAGYGIDIAQNVINDNILISIDDSVVVTETDLTSALANYVTSSNLSSTLANYVTNTSLSTTLSGYATQSWVENKNYVINLSNKVSSLAIGSGASVGAVNSVAIGYGAQTNLAGSIAIGPNAATSWGYSIQLGAGTNISSGTFGVGFGALGNYTLLDGNTGLIPDARLSSNIARISQIPSMTVDQTYDGTSANAQSGVAIAGELVNYVKAQNGNTSYTNTGTETSMGYTDTNAGEMYGVIAGKNATYGTGVILGAQNGGSGYLASVTTNGLGLTNGATMQSAALTVSNNNLAVNGTTVALSTDIPTIATSVNSSSTNAETVGAKLFYDTCGDIETLINSL